MQEFSESLKAAELESFCNFCMWIFLFYKNYFKLHMTKLSIRVKLIPKDKPFYEFPLLAFVWNITLLHFTVYTIAWQMRKFEPQWVLNTNLCIKEKVRLSKQTYRDPCEFSHLRVDFLSGIVVLGLQFLECGLPLLVVHLVGVERLAELVPVRVDLVLQCMVQSMFLLHVLQ